MRRREGEDEEMRKKRMKREIRKEERREEGLVKSKKVV